MNIPETTLLFAASFAAGIVNAIAGGGTLITFPTLIAFGLPAKMANATSTVALWPGLLGGLWGYKEEMANTRLYLIRLGLVSLLGGVTGTLLLIATPSRTFEFLAPYLILFATVLFALQEPVTRWLRFHEDGKPRKTRWWIIALTLQFCSAIYGAYFGAGNGILILAILGLLGLKDIHLANGIKAFLALCLNSVAVIGFAVSGLVSWPAALIMGSGAITGGYFGAFAARKIGQDTVRKTIIGIGLIIGARMLYRLYG